MLRRNPVAPFCPVCSISCHLDLYLYVIEGSYKLDGHACVYYCDRCENSFNIEIYGKLGSIVVPQRDLT
jgi:hypothetical protein